MVWNTLLVGGWEHSDYFSINIGNVILPFDLKVWLSYFSEGLKPPTRWCLGQQLLRFSSTEHVDFGTYHASNQTCLFTEHMIKHCAEFSPNFQTDSSRWVLPSFFCWWINLILLDYSAIMWDRLHRGTYVFLTHLYLIEVARYNHIYIYH